MGVELQAVICVSREACDYPQMALLSEVFTRTAVLCGEACFCDSRHLNATSSQQLKDVPVGMGKMGSV